MTITEIRIEKLKRLLVEAQIQEPEYDPFCSNAVSILREIIFYDNHLSILMQDLEKWDQYLLYDLFVVLDVYTWWRDDERQAMPFHLFLYLFIKLDISNYDVILDGFHSHRNMDKVDRELLLKAQAKLIKIKSLYLLDAYLEGWWQHAMRRVKSCLGSDLW